MFKSFRRALTLVDARRRRKFTYVGLLSLCVSGLEAVSAVLVLVLIKLIAEPGDVPVIPLVGDLGRLFPGATRQDLVVGFAATFAAFFALRAVLFLGQQYALARVAQNTGVVISHRLLRGYLVAPYVFHLRRNSAESVRNVHDNTQQLINSVLIPLTTLFAESVMVLLMLSVLVASAPLVTLVAAATMGAAVGVSLMIVQPRLKRQGLVRQQASRMTFQHLQQGLQGLRDIKVAGREDTFSDLFRRARGRFARAEYTRAVLAYVPRVIVETAFLLFIVIVLLFAEVGGSAGGLLSTLGLFAYAGMRLQPSLQKIANALNSVRYAEPVITDLEHDFAQLEMHLRERERTHSSSVTPLPFNDVLCVDDLSFTYPGSDQPALDRITLSIAPGESVGIAGPTGGGKSTLLDILCGLLHPTHGRVTVDDVDIASHTRAWHRSIGVVHQSSFLIDDSVRNNIVLGMADTEIDEELLWSVVDAAELGPVIAELEQGLHTRVGERGVRLSGGQRQRIALARALYRQPRLLILDEATSALDNITEQRVMTNMERLSYNMAVVAVAHRMRTIRASDKVLLLSDGRLAGVGTYDELRDSNQQFAALST